MRKFASLFAALFIAGSLLLVSLPKAAALPVAPQPPVPTAPDILVTSIVGTPLLNTLEIYNQSDSPINLAGWNFTFTAKDSSGCSNGRTASVAFPSGWILSKNYLTFVNDGSPAVSAVFTVDPNLLAGCVAPWLASIQILQAGTVEQSITIPSNPTPLSLATGVKQKQRDNASSSARTLTGAFNSDYAPLSSSDTTFFNDPLYMPPSDSAGLQIVELLPNSDNCSPTDTSLTCGDFVKLFNGSKSPIDLSAYRLRSSYGGNKTTTSNTISLSGTLVPDAYVIVNTKNDGSPLSLTESGGYVWLEDAYGAQMYQPIIGYPDASSTTKVGWAWAFDGTTWQWTSDPTLATNDFPPADQAADASATSSLKPCAAGQYRNPETNRCREIIVSASTLVPCKPDEERNPATNRCRSVLAASTSSLTPCKAGQERNPATNRCRSISATTTSTLKPCQPGWTRNSATNRCRKGSVLGDTTAKIQDVKAPINGSNLRWLLAVGAVAIALAYAFYEWRQEIVLKYAEAKLRATTVIHRK